MDEAGGRRLGANGDGQADGNDSVGSNKSDGSDKDGKGNMAGDLGRRSHSNSNSRSTSSGSNASVESGGSGGLASSTGNAGTSSPGPGPGPAPVPRRGVAEAGEGIAVPASPSSASQASNNGALGDGPNAGRGHHRRRSSVSREFATQEMVQLPLLRDVPMAEHCELFRMKLELCKVRFNFDDPNSNQMGKDLKRNTLLELIEYVNTEQGQKIFVEPGMGEAVVSMISANIFRALPPQLEEFDPEEDEPVLEPSWPHLQVVYEFLLRFVISKEVVAKAAKRKDVIDQTFCLKLVQIFDSEDPRERDYLKTIMHRVYGKFMPHRSFIRRQISYAFQRFAFETQRHNGVGELLEILGSIINGFALPLKQEHLRFLVTSLIPLHKAPSVTSFHHQLSYCIVQYLEKDSTTIIPIIRGLAKYWPWSQSSKQVMFLNELEDVLESVNPELVPQILPFVLKIVVRSISSEHFQVVERTLYLWNNEQLALHVFGRQHSELVFPKIFDCLWEKEGHWNPTVKNLADEVIRLNKTRINGVLWSKLEEETQRRKEEQARQAENRKVIWEALKHKHVSAVDDHNHPVLMMRSFNAQPPVAPTSMQ